jgi:hypothetical protein
MTPSSPTLVVLMLALVLASARAIFTLRIVTTFDAGAPQFPREAQPPHTQDIRVRVR